MVDLLLITNNEKRVLQIPSARLEGKCHNKRKNGGLLFGWAGQHFFSEVLLISRK
jgi:hypothetical protein